MIRSFSSYPDRFSIFPLGAVTAALFSLAFAVSASAPADSAGGAEKFNAGKMIMEHIADAHDWHLFDWGGHAVSIPLPVILYEEGRGLSFFLSSEFDHGHATARDRYRLEGSRIVVAGEGGKADEEATAALWDFSITKNTASLFISIALMLWIFTSVAGAYRTRRNKKPAGLQSFLEPVIVFVRDEIAKSVIGEKKYEKYLPFLLTVFFFIWINNMLGLIPIFPGGANLTGNIAVPMALALITFIITTVSSNRHYWRHVFAMPGVPVAVLAILTPIEIMGVLLKPFVLMVRLFANITAGHIIILSFFSLIFIFGEMGAAAGWGIGVFSLAFVIFMSFLELLVAFIQAYVFTLLSAMYFAMATEEHH